MALTPCLSSRIGLCDIQDLDRLNISINITNGLLSPEHDPSPGTEIRNLKTSNHNALIRSDTPPPGPIYTQLIPHSSRYKNTDTTKAYITSVQYTDMPNPKKPIALMDSCIRRIKIILKQVQAYAKERFLCSNSLSGGTTSSPKQKKKTFDLTQTMQNKLIYAMGIMVQKPSPQAWQLINKSCQIIDNVLLQQSRSIIRLLLRIFSRKK